MTVSITLFQQEVYKIVETIPRGKVMTYQEVALAIGSPGSCRAVGNALNKNRDPAVPCHRVIRSDGKAGGYRDGANKKIQLLKKEGVKKPHL